MFIFATHERLTSEQRSAWALLQAQLSLLPKEDGSGDGWLFHGTDQISATWIMKEGFGHTRWPGMPQNEFQAYFGPLETAISFAEKRMEGDSPPAILAVKTSDLVSVGVEKDDNYDDDASGDWREYVRNGGTVRIAGGQSLPTLQHFGISSVPLHPSAEENRVERMRSSNRYYGSRPPHPAEEPTVLHLQMRELQKYDMTPSRIAAFLDDMSSSHMPNLAEPEVFAEHFQEWVDSQEARLRP